MVPPGWLGVLGAVLSLGLPALGSGYAMERIGQLSERLLPEVKDLFSKALILSVLAETPTIYGLVVGTLCLLNLPTDFLSSLGHLLAGLSVGLPGLAAAYSIGLVAQAGLLALREKPSLFPQVLVLAALPEAIAIYGLVMALLSLSAAGMFGESKLVGLTEVGSLALASVITWLSSLIALFIAKVSVSAVRALVEDEGAFAKALVIAVLPESIALYALLVAVLILQGSGLL